MGQGLKFENEGEAALHEVSRLRVVGLRGRAGVVGVLAVGGIAAGVPGAVGSAAAVPTASSSSPAGLQLPSTLPPEAQPPSLASTTASPAAVSERLRSASEFRGESPAAALSTAQSVFPGAVSAPVWRGPVLPAGSSVRRYLSSSTALVTTPGTRRLGLLDSTASLMGHTAAGAAAPVDLGLVASGGGFAPVSAAVRVQIPASSSGVVSFTASGIGVGLPQAGAPVDALLSHDRAFYGAVSTDEDVSVSAVAQGAEVNVFLRSPAAATDVPLAFTLPAGAVLRLADTSGSKPDPPGSVVIEQWRRHDRVGAGGRRI